jgi:hypothetical protein
MVAPSLRASEVARLASVSNLSSRSAGAANWVAAGWPAAASELPHACSAAEDPATRTAAAAVTAPARSLEDRGRMILLLVTHQSAVCNRVTG